MAVPYPSPEQVKEAATEVGLSLTDDDVKSYIGLDERHGRRVQRRRPHAGLSARGEVSAHARLLPVARGEQAQRLVREDLDQGRAIRAAQGQESRGQGQRDGGRRADDEWLLDPGRLRAGDRRDGRRAHSRCGRRNRGQDALRVVLHLGRHPHRSEGPGAQPLQDGLLRGRLVVGQRRGRGAGRSRHGARRRSGRLDPHAVIAGAASTA